MIVLVDCNNFYVSCERSFNPDLEGKAVVVLSNNDGNVIARSNEAKILGVKMGTPFFQLKEIIGEHDIHVYSSNYALYGDLSARVMACLGHFVEQVEVYSIDEAFLNLDGYTSLYPDLRELARLLRETVRRWTRIPVSVGLAPTKTLCKVANYFAKRQPEHGGILLLDDPALTNALLHELPVSELWGVGSRYAPILRRAGITTAAQLRDAPDEWIGQVMTVNGLRLAHELRGFPCKLLDLDPSPKKAICTAPSFGRPVADLATVTQALITHLGRAAEKLRAQGSAAGSLTVFLHTNRHRKTAFNGLPAKQYYNARTVNLPHPSASTVELARYAEAALKSVYRFGYEYQKVGVMLTGLVPGGHRQASFLTGGPDERLVKLSATVDRLNHRFGRDKVRLAGAGYDTTWHHKQQWMSPAYTTRWTDIIKAR